MTLLLLGLDAVIAVCCVCCAWPLTFGIQAQPNYAMAGFGAVITGLIFLFWVILFLNEMQLERAVDVSAEILKLTDQQRAELTEEDPRFEQNSGIRRWKNA